MHPFERYRLLRLSSPLRQDLCLDGEIPGTRIEVTVHYLSSDNRGEDDAVLLKAELLDPEFREQIVELGYENGTPFVVTRRLAGGLSVRTWVLQSLIETQKRKAGAEPVRVEAEPERQLVATLPPESFQTANTGLPAAPATGEFTRFLRGSSATLTKAAPKIPVMGAGGTGEFTRLLRTTEPPPSTGMPVEPVFAEQEGTIELPRRGAAQDQDATRIFHQPVNQHGAVGPGMAPGGHAGQGEYTMMIQQQDAREFAGLGESFAAVAPEPARPGAEAAAAAPVGWHRLVPIIAALVILCLLAAVAYVITSIG